MYMLFILVDLWPFRMFHYRSYCFCWSTSSYSCPMHFAVSSQNISFIYRIMAAMICKDALSVESMQRHVTAWFARSCWNGYLQGISKYSEKIFPSVILAITKSTWHDLGSTPGRRGEKLVANRLGMTYPSISVSQFSPDVQSKSTVDT
jgi:hypothetical protein